MNDKEEELPYLILQNNLPKKETEDQNIVAEEQKAEINKEIHQINPSVTYSNFKLSRL